MELKEEQSKSKQSESQTRKKPKRKYVKPSCIVVLAIVVAMALLISSGLLPSADDKITKDDVITSSQLEKAVDISQLSTAEFIYNGVAEKYKDNNKDKVECYIAYNANVKVGISMTDIKYEIDQTNKTVTPILPEITVNVATLDEDAISYIPADPDVELQEVISLCKEDAMNEAANSRELYQTAEENLKSVIEALIKPLLENKGYTIDWAATETGTESQTDNLAVESE